MHSEHLSNVSVVAIIVGWVIAVAATSVLVFLMAALGLFGPEDGVTLWALLAVALGFFAGGYLTGTRDIEAPILHGIGIGLTTLVAWFVLNLLAGLFAEGEFGAGLPASLTAGLLLLQMGMAVTGAWIADRRALAGEDLPGETLS